MNDWTSWSYSRLNIDEADPMYMACGENIGVEPWPEEAKKPKAVGGAFKTVEQKSSLQPLKVVIGNEKFPAGCTVYVNAELFIHQWAKVVYDIDGQKFILCPVKQIELAKY